MILILVRFMQHQNKNHYLIEYNFQKQQTTIDKFFCKVSQ